MVDFSVIVPIYNKSELTLQFVRDISNHLTDGQLILVDNKSRDVLNPLILKNFLGDKYKPLNLDKNYGFGIANNRGAKIAVGRHLFFTSNDVRINGDCFSSIIKILDREDILIGQEIVDWNSGWNTYQETGIIPYVQGYFMACRAQSFFDVGMFWEDLWLDMEDLELSYRWTQSGKKILAIKSLPIIHLGGRTAMDIPEGRLKITLESQKKVMEKYGWNK